MAVLYPGKTASASTFTPFWHWIEDLHALKGKSLKDSKRVKGEIKSFSTIELALCPSFIYREKVQYFWEFKHDLLNICWISSIETVKCHWQGHILRVRDSPVNAKQGMMTHMEI